MCGYFANLHDFPFLIELMRALGIPLPYPRGQYWQRRQAAGLVTQELDGYALSETIWWYQLKPEQGKYVVNEKITSFNARNLDQPLWKQAVATRRCLLLATEIGESLGAQHYLMRAQGGLVLGGVYRDWPVKDGPAVRSFALITRPPHPRFRRYHDKSIPLFLPNDVQFLQDWLNPSLQTNDAIQAVLDEPKITRDLVVTPVKTFKRAEITGQPEILAAD